MNKKFTIFLTSAMVLIGGIFLTYNIYQNKNKVNKAKRKGQNNLAIMIKDDGATEYNKSNSKDIPKGNYTLNREKSYCKNNGVIGDYDSTLGKVSFSFIGTDSCYLYFDFHKIKLYETIENKYKEDAAKNYLDLYTGEGADTYANPVYYYKGAVQNNNVLFGGFCWKIVRTTDTGGVKIVYNGVQKDGSCNNTGTDSQIGTSAFNVEYNTPSSVGYMFLVSYMVSKKSMSSESNIVFGNSFTYSNGTYKLTSTKTIATWSSGYNTINNNHYTCMSTGTSCTELYYVYYTDSSTAYYILLFGGRSVEDALDDMLNSNSSDSIVKSYIDNWYEKNLINYANDLEDTVFCNDRTISSLGGWDPNGGSTSEDLTFKNVLNGVMPSNKSLVCPRENDSFSVSNVNAKLKYPIGLLSSPELVLSGYMGGDHYFNNGEYVWTGSPATFMVSFRGIGIVDNTSEYGWDLGTIDTGVGDKKGVRPSVSLKPNIKYISGDGSFTNPFVIE